MGEEQSTDHGNVDNRIIPVDNVMIIMPHINLTNRYLLYTYFFFFFYARDPKSWHRSGVGAKWALQAIGENVENFVTLVWNQIKASLFIVAIFLRKMHILF